MPPRDIDLENATKALHAAQFLVSDLRALVSSADLLLSDVALRELADAAALEGRLQRVVLALTPRDGAAAT
jgi:trans-aconitate methyltransferase